MQEFLSWLQSLSGAGLTEETAWETARIASMALCFETKATDEAIWREKDSEEAGILSPGRVTRFLKFVEDQGLAPNTMVPFFLVFWLPFLTSFLQSKYAAALATFADWRISLLQWHSDESNARLLRLYGIMKTTYANVKKQAAKKRSRQKRLTKEEETRNGRWVTFEEFREAVRAMLPAFKLAVTSAQKSLASDSPISATSYNTALTFVVAVYYANNQPTRPGPLQDLTIEQWQQVAQTGEFSTQDFKTRKAYGFACIKFDQDTLKAWQLFITTFRSKAAPSERCLATQSGKLVSCNRILTMLTKRALGVHVGPTRLRQILATEANTKLNREEADKFHRGDLHSSEVGSAQFPPESFTNRL